MAGRGLDQVFHYLIPEDEQRAARDRARERDSAPAAATGCWWIGVDPSRALARAAAVELAGARARAGQTARVLASFGPGQLLRPSPGVRWERRDPAAIAAVLRDGSRPSLLLARPGELAELAPAGDAALDGLALLIDASPRGAESALSWLAGYAARFEGWRIGAIVAGAARPADAARLVAGLAGDARRRLGLELEELGSIGRDVGSFRSLLHGASVFELEPGSRTALDLTALARRLGGGPGAGTRSAP